MPPVISSSAALRRKKNMRKSVNFTVMVIGQSGSGRSTFINSLCDQLIVEPSSTAKMYSPEDLGHPDRELQLRKSTVELEDEEGVRINMNIIDTPGFGDSLNNEMSFEVIKDYLKYQFDEILIEESKLRRNPRFKDNRVHVCLYMIVATGHGLREIDVETIKTLGEYVNVLPCIAKSDSLSVEELRLNKRLIKEDIEYYKLPVFGFTNEYFTLEADNDDDALELNKYLEKTMPFALMGSNTTVKDDAGELHRVRKYPWGTVDVFDNDVSDVLTLKTTLLVTHLSDFKDYTHEVLYENYRAKTLSEVENGTAEYGGSVASMQAFAKQHAASNGGTANGAADYSAPASPAIGSGNGPASSAPGDTDPEIEAKEEQIRLEEERLKAYESRVQRDLVLKREEIEAREKELAEIERRLAEQEITD